MAPFQRILFVLGEHKARQLGRLQLEALVDELGGRAVVTVQVTEQPDQVAARIAAFHGQVDCVAVGGGDGTLRCAAGALVETGVPMLVIPLGTANDLARTLGVPLDPVQAAKLVRTGRREDIDLGQVNGAWFFNVAGIGMSVDVAERLARTSKRWGPFEYALAFANIWRSRRPFRAEIECDGRQVSLDSLQISVGNGLRHGGGIKVAEDASIDDGLFDVYSVAPQSLWRLLARAPALLQGTHHMVRGVTNLRGRKVVVRTPNKRKRVNADGEVVAFTPAHFTMHRNGVVVLLPRPVAT